MLLSKKAQQPKPYSPTPNVVIEPIDPLVQQAVNDIKRSNPNFFLQVEKIVVHFGGGAGNLGHVKRGPNDNPRVIHIYKDRIKAIIQRDLGGKMDAKSFEQAVRLAISEVIAHEKSHIGERPEEFFHGESEAERGGAEMAKKLQPQFKADDVIASAALVLNDIQEKYLPTHSLREPTLTFLVYAAQNDKFNLIKEGIKILKDKPNEQAISSLIEAQDFNKNRTVLKHAGLIPQVAHIPIDSIDFAINLAIYQTKMGLPVTGKLDTQTVKTATKFIRFSDLPSNFGIVFPNLLYRGAIIRHPSQLRNLKDICGVERVVSLHNNPEVLKICKFLDIEYVPAFLEQGAPTELGRKVFGNSVSEFLLQKSTYIHCFFGEDRTGGVIARLRTEMGWPCKMAYLEAKAYGFKDIFTDFIEWFTEPTGQKSPVDIQKIRELLDGRNPYTNPEDSMVQELLEPTPNDMPFGNPFCGTGEHLYTTWSDTVNNITPSSIQPPIPTDSTGV